MRQKPKILIIDKQNIFCKKAQKLLGNNNELFITDSGKSGLEILKINTINVVLLDIHIPYDEGFEIFEEFKKCNDHIILMTTKNKIQNTIKITKQYAYDFIIEPFNIAVILHYVNKILKKQNFNINEQYLLPQVIEKPLTLLPPENKNDFAGLVGNSEPMKKIYKLIKNISQNDGTVLIQGESGTGKELIARALHLNSKRCKEPFIIVDCAAIPQTLMESEIFGYNKGAFTGANANKLGKIEIANGGTVLFDDIDTLSPQMQANLLRLLQNKEFERLGSNKIIRANVRFLAATNQNILNLIEQEKFREDLYYRLNVFPIYVPPLRERRHDIPHLLNHFLQYFAVLQEEPIKEFSKSALQELINYDWPGNIRELRNMVERLSSIVEDHIIDTVDFIEKPRVVSKKKFEETKADIHLLLNSFISKKTERHELKENIQALFIDKIAKELMSKLSHNDKNVCLKNAVTYFEHLYIQSMLILNNGNKMKTAQDLGVHRNTLSMKLKEYNLDPHDIEL